jgi:hypothetical protein
VIDTGCGGGQSAGHSIGRPTQKVYCGSAVAALAADGGNLAPALPVVGPVLWSSCVLGCCPRAIGPLRGGAYAVRGGALAPWRRGGVAVAAFQLTGFDPAGNGVDCLRSVDSEPELLRDPGRDRL